MNQLPAYCRNCHTIFPSRAILVGGTVRDLTLTDNKESCPKCGAMADTAEGTFQMVGGVLSVIQASDFTRYQFEAIRKIVEERTGGNRATLDDIVSAIGEVSPPLGAVLRRGRKDWKTGLLLAVLLVLFTKCSLPELKLTVDANQLIDQVTQRGDYRP